MNLSGLTVGSKVHAAFSADVSGRRQGGSGPDRFRASADGTTEAGTTFAQNPASGTPAQSFPRKYGEGTNPAGTGPPRPSTSTTTRSAAAAPAFRTPSTT